MRELHFGLIYQGLRWILQAREYSNDWLELGDRLEERAKVSYEDASGCFISQMKGARLLNKERPTLW
jgi:hypothetical protein